MAPFSHITSYKKKHLAPFGLWILKTILRYCIFLSFHLILSKEINFKFLIEGIKSFAWQLIEPHMSIHSLNQLPSSFTLFMDYRYCKNSKVSVYFLMPSHHPPPRKQRERGKTYIFWFLVVPKDIQHRASSSIISNSQREISKASNFSTE